MTTALTSENIQTLHGERLAGLSGWEISFRSDNQGMHHQMYVNGQLADFTDTLSQRAFHVDLEDFPQEIAIVAVDSHRRMSDMSAELPSQLGQPTWIGALLPFNNPNSPSEACWHTWTTIQPGRWILPRWSNELSAPPGRRTGASGTTALHMAALATTQPPLRAADKAHSEPVASASTRERHNWQPP